MSEKPLAEAPVLARLPGKCLWHQTPSLSWGAGQRRGHLGKQTRPSATAPLAAQWLSSHPESPKKRLNILTESCWLIFFNENVSSSSPLTYGFTQFTPPSTRSSHLPLLNEGAASVRRGLTRTCEESEQCILIGSLSR